MPSRSSSWSLVRPVFRKKPSSACGGAEVRGPFTSSRLAWVAPATSRAMTTRRRGVENVSIEPVGSPASPVHSANSRATSLRALACIRAGISSDRSSSRKSALIAPLHHWLFGQWSPSPFRGGSYLLLQPGAARGLRQVTHAADISLPLGDADHAAGLQRVEHVARLDRLLIGRDRQLALDAQFAFGDGFPKSSEQPISVCDLEIILGRFALILEEHVAVADAGVVESQVEDVVDALDVHRQPLEAVSQLAGDRFALEPADLLEVSELGHLHPVAPDLPAEAPGAERGTLPIVFDETDVVLERVDADFAKTAEIQLLQIVRARLQHDLILVVMAEAAGIFSVSAVGRAAARLGISGAPPVGPKRAQHRRRMEGPRPHLHVIGLEDHAPLRAPIMVQGEDQVLETQAQAIGPVRIAFGMLWRSLQQSARLRR